MSAPLPEMGRQCLIVARTMFREGMNFDEAVAEFRRLYLLTALEANRWNQTRAAAELGMSASTMMYHVKRLGITIPIGTRKNRGYARCSN